MRIAIVRDGITGLSTAWLLNHRHPVTLYERNDYFGGHSNTRLVETETYSNKFSIDFLLLKRINKLYVS
jgi:predicted NAD/FAD-binding protein